MTHPQPKSLIVYLSGPMSGIKDFNTPAFTAGAASLRASGYTVINPAELDALDVAPMRWEQYLRRDIRALMDADMIALLPGWEKSRGARLEKYIAEALGMRPIFVNVAGTVPA